MDVNGNELPHGCDRPLPLNAKIGYKRSTGALYCKYAGTDSGTESDRFQRGAESEILSWCANSGAQCRFEYNQVRYAVLLNGY